MKREFDTKWDYNEHADWWELPPPNLSGHVFTAVRNKQRKWNLVRGCNNCKLIGVFKYLKDAKRAGILYQELNHLIKLDKL
jgi:CRISPR/Cas system CMR-associated protein Cmr3 (group 5 of RAMP superfamily)